MITQMRIDLETATGGSGMVALLDGARTVYSGSVDTDLAPGQYVLTPDKPRRRWVIRNTSPGLRFNVALDGPDPFAIAYAAHVALTVSAAPQGGNQNEEMLPGIGSDAYKDDAAYVDRVVAGHYDVANDVFTVDYADGSSVELDYPRLVSDLRATTGGTATVYVFYRNLRNNRIYPRIFDARTTPNIAAMVLEVEAALPGARALGRISRFLLDLVQVRAQTAVRPPATRATSARPWSAVPRSDPKTVLRMAGAFGNPPSIKFGQYGAGADQLFASVQVIEGEVVYEVQAIAATGSAAKTVLAAHRAMLVAAAQEAQRLGRSTFRLVGRQANDNFRRHADKLARAVGPGGQVKLPPAGSFPYPDATVTLSVDSVLATNVGP